MFRSTARCIRRPDKIQQLTFIQYLNNRRAHLDRPLQQRSTTMQDTTDANHQASRRDPGKKGKLIGAKPPLRPKHVWSIRTKLQIAGRTRDLAMFNLAIDSKLRGC